MTYPVLWGAYCDMPTKAVKPSKAAEAMTLRHQKILDLLKQGKTETGIPFNYMQIGRIVSLNRERVRQLALAMLGETGQERQAVIKAAWVAQPKPLLQAMTRLQWLQTFKRWLAEPGYAWCTCGRHIVPTVDISRTCPYRCNACVSAKTQAYYATAEGKAKTLKWQADNAERVKEYQRRYHASPERKATVAERYKRAYWKNRAKGRCTKCKGRVTETREGKTMVYCKLCRARHNEGGRARYAARKRIEAPPLNTEVGAHA